MELELSIGGLWFVVGGSSDPRPARCRGRLLAPRSHDDCAVHRPRLSFATLDLADVDGLEPKLELDVAGNGIGVLDLADCEVAIEVDAASVDAQVDEELALRWAADPDQERPLRPADQAFLDWILYGPWLGVESLVDGAPGASSCCRCTLPGGTLSAWRLYTGGRAEPPVWRYGNGKRKALADRLRVDATAATRVTVRVDGPRGAGTLDLENDDGVVRVMVSNDLVEARSHRGPEPTTLAHLAHLQELVATGRVESPVRVDDTRSDVPICPLVFMPQPP